MVQFECPRARVIHYVHWACRVTIHAQNVIPAPPASHGVPPGEVREKVNSAAVRKTWVLRRGVFDIEFIEYFTETEEAVRRLRGGNQDGKQI